MKLKKKHMKKIVLMTVLFGTYLATAMNAKRQLKRKRDNIISTNELEQLTEKFFHYQFHKDFTENILSASKDEPNTSRLPLISPYQRKIKKQKTIIYSLALALGLPNFEGPCNGEGCNYIITAKNKTTHLRWHKHEKSDHPCDICKVAYHQRDNLKNHLKSKPHKHTMLKSEFFTLKFIPEIIFMKNN